MSDQEQLPEAVLEAVTRYRSAEARAAYLDAACGPDHALRQRVEQLLADSGEALTANENERTPSIVDAWVPLTEKPGDRIGRYKLLQQIGEGGFGVVYLAEQEEPIRRRVALKVIKLGMDTRAVVGRFEAERQALALMNHPNIAKVHDGGATDSGRPYFVMELVRGLPITEYCDQNKLSTRERLDLFTEVCLAIQHAHQKGVIHRDIKPSNILVTVEEDRPRPKVIDFGIAKATGARLTDKTVFTAFEQFIGTPAYVSPEQVEMSSAGAGDIDTRSDIYSLGVLLYELLTGNTPFDTRQLVAAGLDEMRRKIRDEDPPRPSTRLTTLPEAELATVARQRRSELSQLHSQLRGDLDWISMKALEKDRTRRYQTVGALAEDIGRHLHHEPVQAAPPSVGYRLKKLARRNKPAVAVLGALLLGIVLSLWQAQRAQAARDVAEQNQLIAETNRVEAERHIAFMLDDLYDKLEPLVRVDLMQDVVEDAKGYFDRIFPVEDASPESQYNRSLIMDSIGRMAFQAWEDNVAESNFLAALEIRERLTQQQPNHVKWLRGKAEILHRLGQLNYRTARLERRLSYIEAGLQTLSNLVQIAPSDLEVQALLGQNLLLRGRVRNRQSPAGSAVLTGEMLQARALFERLCQQEPEEKRWQHLLASSHYTLGRTYVAYSTSDDDKAEAALLVALRINTNLLSRASQNLSWHNQLGWCHLKLAEIYQRDPKRVEEAKLHTEQAQKLFDELLRQDSFVRRYSKAGFRTATRRLLELYDDDALGAMTYLRAVSEHPLLRGDLKVHRDLYDSYWDVIRSARAGGQRELSRQLEREFRNFLRKSWQASWSRARPADARSLQQEAWNYHVLAEFNLQLLDIALESGDYPLVQQLMSELIDTAVKHTQVAFASSEEQESWLVLFRAKVLYDTGRLDKALQAVNQATNVQERADFWGFKSKLHEALGQQAKAKEARTQMWDLIGNSVTGQWDFDSGDLRATVGDHLLEYFDEPNGKTKEQTEFDTTTELAIPDIGGQPARVMNFPKADRTMGFVMRHGAKPNGRGTNVNQYTVIMDILWHDEPEGGTNWSAFLQTNLENSNDEDLCARWENGTAGIGIGGRYAGKTHLVSGRWHRVAFAVDASEPVVTKFIDGVKHSDQHDLREWEPAADPTGRDKRFSLAPAVLLFTDDSGDTLAGYVNSIQFHNVKLPDLVLEMLGGPEADGIPRKY